MSISGKLADLEFGSAIQDLESTFYSEERKASYLCFFWWNVYTGLDAYSIPIEHLDKLQDSLRILSGLYGLLKPLDLIRLPFGNGDKLAVGDDKKNNFGKPK
jgi:cytoplasmic iron level regulating protein YaaA (DUF328/UPF0246 family)